MSKVEEIKLAAAKLTFEEQFEFFKWWCETEQFKRHQLKTLRSDLAVGLQQLEAGQYQTYTEESIARLAEEVSSHAKQRLGKSKPRE